MILTEEQKKRLLRRMGHEVAEPAPAGQHMLAAAWPPSARETQFIGVCGPLRAHPGGETRWQDMMADRTSISLEAFELLVPNEDFRCRWGSTLEEASRQDPSAGAYISHWGDKLCVFYQNAGFEYIWWMP